MHSPHRQLTTSKPTLNGNYNVKTDLPVSWKFSSIRRRPSGINFRFGRIFPFFALINGCDQVIVGIQKKVSLNDAKRRPFAHRPQRPKNKEIWQKLFCFDFHLSIFLFPFSVFIIFETFWYYCVQEEREERERESPRSNLPPSPPFSGRRKCLCVCRFVLLNRYNILLNTHTHIQAHTVKVFFFFLKLVFTETHK